MDYTNYWENENWAVRDKRQYYQKLYGQIKHKLPSISGSKILDIGGGDGHLMHYLGLNKVDIIDISDSGIKIANKLGFNTITADIQRSFPIKNNIYNIAFCFEVFEHLHHPEIAANEIYRVLKDEGVFYVGQPNMRADGDHHVRRFYKKGILKLLTDSGFSIEWIDYVPGFIMRDAIIDDIRKTKSAFRKIKQSIALVISLLPRKILYLLACLIPDRFCLIFVIKAKK